LSLGRNLASHAVSPSLSCARCAVVFTLFVGQPPSLMCPDRTSLQPPTCSPTAAARPVRRASTWTTTVASSGATCGRRWVGSRQCIIAVWADVTMTDAPKNGGMAPHASCMQIHFGPAKRPWHSSGAKARGLHAGTYTTYWNLTSDDGTMPGLQPDFGPALNFIGEQRAMRSRL
jgi:hypothetical protein